MNSRRRSRWPRRRRGVNVNDGPALDGVCRELGIGRMQIAESAGPPLTLGVDVRSGRKQDVDHRATPRRSGEVNRRDRSAR